MRHVSTPATFLLVFALLTLAGCSAMVPKLGFPAYSGQIGGLPVDEPVEVLRDGWGIPHIYARSEKDLMAALGFVHAQDRLWQMEVNRRFAAGRLAEVAGRELVNLDYFVRLLGYPELTRRAAEAVSPETRELLQAYLDGINVFLEKRGRNLPLEFRLLGHRPEPWKLEDLFSPVMFMIWPTHMNHRIELFAVTAARSLTLDQWNLLFPSAPGVELPGEDFFDRARDLDIAPLHPAVFSLYEPLPERSVAAATGGAGGTNNWVVARGEGGRPLLANDPHLSQMVPTAMYLCDLHAPGLQASGATFAGTPVIAIGHNGAVAWGLSTLMLDGVDLYLLEVDRDRPTRYRVGDRFLEMSREQVTVDLPRGKTETLPLYRTIYGPVITKVEAGGEAAVAIRYAGTLDEGITDRSLDGFFSLMHAGSVEEALESGRMMKLIGMNLIAADADGHIGFHSLGSVPIRQGYSGRLPANGSSGDADWLGFLDYDELPRSLDPPEGWIVNANNRIGDSERPLSYCWATDYRYQRILDLLQRSATPSVEDFRRIQTDVFSLEAEQIVAGVLEYSFEEKKAREAAGILARWDRRMAPDSPGAALYAVFVVEWLQELLGDELGDSLPEYINCALGLYSVEDVILSHPKSSLWDRIDTPEREGPRDILERALVRTVERLEKSMGRDQRDWRWDRLHTYVYRHAAGRFPIIRRMVNRGPYPAPGGYNTVNVAQYNAGMDSFEVVELPVLRMVVPLGRPENTRVMTAMGQSGQPGHPHYDDLIQPFLAGRMIPLALDRQEAVQTARLLLIP